MHILYFYAYKANMRTTLDLPEKLLDEVMKIGHFKTKTAAIVDALENVVRKSKLSELKKYRGKVDMDIDLDVLRERGKWTL